jgi:hypothetical protein
MPELFKLIGIVIVVVGLALKLRTTLVVVTAGLVTGLVAGLPLLSSAGIFEGVPVLTKPGQEGIINILGRAFADNRLMTLFIITLPAIGLAERYGLQEQAAEFIRRISAATVGRLLITYQLRGRERELRELLRAEFVARAGRCAARLRHVEFARAWLPGQSVEHRALRHSGCDSLGRRRGRAVPPARQAHAASFGEGTLEGIHPCRHWQTSLRRSLASTRFTC